MGRGGVGNLIYIYKKNFKSLFHYLSYEGFKANSQIWDFERIYFTIYRLRAKVTQKFGISSALGLMTFKAQNAFLWRRCNINVHLGHKKRSLVLFCNPFKKLSGDAVFFIFTFCFL